MSEWGYGRSVSESDVTDLIMLPVYAIVGVTALAITVLFAPFWLPVYAIWNIRSTRAYAPVVTTILLLILAAYLLVTTQPGSVAWLVSFWTWR